MQKTLAIDLGLKRIGLAYTASGTVVTPLPAVERKNRNQASSEVKQAIVEWDVEQLVVGIPMGGDSEEEMRRRVAHFTGLLDFEGEIHLQDEAETSIEAKERMKGVMRQKRDGRIDSIAAQIILERFLKI